MVYPNVARVGGLRPDYGAEGAAVVGYCNLLATPVLCPPLLLYRPHHQAFLDLGGMVHPAIPLEAGQNFLDFAITRPASVHLDKTGHFVKSILKRSLPFP